MPRPHGSGRSTALKVLAGEQASKINDDEPQPKVGRPTCPTTDLEVRMVWDYTIQQLEHMNIVSMVDRDLLHAYCEAVVIHRAACATVRREGAVIVGGSTGFARHPAVAIAKDAAVLMKTLGMQFGLTPAGRTAIRVTDSQPKPREQGAARLLTG